MDILSKYLLNLIKESKYNDLLQNSMYVTNLEAIDVMLKKTMMLVLIV